MSVVKFYTACLLLVVTYSTDAAFVKKYLEARLLAQMLSNPQFPDPSLWGALPVLPKPSEDSFAQMALPWRMRLAPPLESDTAHQAHLYGPSHFDDHPVDGHHHHNSHFDFPSQEELSAVMMKMPPSMVTKDPGSAAPMGSTRGMSPMPLSSMTSSMSPKYFGQKSSVSKNKYNNNNNMKSSLSERDLEALVLKMKQINKDIDEVSDDQMRQMISQSLASKPSADENEKFSEDTNKEDMSQMNIMKPADRLIDPRTQTKSSESAAKENHDKTKPKMTPAMLPLYPMPVPAARFSISQMPAQQGLMSRMPQAFRSAMSSFGFGGQRKSPTGWNTPIGMNSLGGQRLSPYSPYGHSLPSMNVGMHPAFEALMYPKPHRSVEKDASPAYLGAVSQNRGTFPSRNVDELRSQMEKIMNEMQRKGGRQNPYAPPKSAFEERNKVASSEPRNVAAVADLKSDRGDVHGLNQAESVVAEVTTSIPTETSTQ